LIKPVGRAASLLTISADQVPGRAAPPRPRPLRFDGAWPRLGASGADVQWLCMPGRAAPARVARGAIEPRRSVHAQARDAPSNDGRVASMPKRAMRRPTAAARHQRPNGAKREVAPAGGGKRR